MMTKAKAIIKISAYLLFFIAILSFGLERLVWTNASSYPDILVTTHMSKLNEDEYLSMRQSCGEPLEIKVDSSHIAIRCGLVWPFNKVVLVDLEGMSWFVKNNKSK